MPPIHDQWEFYEAVRSLEEELADMGAADESSLLRAALDGPTSPAVLRQVRDALQQLRQTDTAVELGFTRRINSLLRWIAEGP